MRGPLRTDIYTVLSGFFQIEEHPTAEDVKDHGPIQGSENNVWCDVSEKTPANIVSTEHENALRSCQHKIAVGMIRRTRRNSGSDL